MSEKVKGKIKSFNKMNKPEDLKYKMVTIVDNITLQSRDKRITTPISFFPLF